MSIHINPIYLTVVILAWFAIYHLAYAFIAIARDRFGATQGEFLRTARF